MHWGRGEPNEAAESNRIRCSGSRTAQGLGCAVQGLVSGVEGVLLTLGLRAGR